MIITHLSCSSSFLSQADPGENLDTSQGMKKHCKHRPLPSEAGRKRKAASLLVQSFNPCRTNKHWQRFSTAKTFPIRRQGTLHWWDGQRMFAGASVEFWACEQWGHPKKRSNGNKTSLCSHKKPACKPVPGAQFLS